MSTNRKRRTRSMKQTAISPAWRRFWETGEYGHQTEDDADIFLLQNRPDDLKAAWDAVKDEIMADWKRSGKRGRPWVAKQFDHETKGRGWVESLGS
jgi:hypothetical protein